MNIKQNIANCIKTDFINADFENLIIESISADKGDYSLPCFSFAKELRDNPINIANKIKDCVEVGGIIEKCEVIAGYVNFFLNKEKVTEEIINNILDNEISYNYGKGKTICIDYSSVNLAKYMHIGHLKNTIIGECIDIKLFV